MRHNLEPAIVVSPDGHRWAEAAEAVERAATYGDPLYTQLVKIIALLDLFGRPFSIKPTKALLHATLASAKPVAIDAALALLEKNSIIVFRKHMSSWAIFAGSDIDLDAETNAIKDRLSDTVTSWDIISQKLRPVVAKRYYHNTGSLRWFERKIEYIANLKPGLSPTSHFILAISNKRDSVEKEVQALSKLSNHVVGFSPLASRIPPLALELSALEEVGRSLAGLAGDKVARRELSGRIDIARNTLSRVIEKPLHLKAKLLNLTTSWGCIGKSICQEDPYEVLWRFSPKVAARVQDYHFHPTQRMETQPDGSVMVRFTAGSWKEMCWHVMTWEGHAEILEPPHLRKSYEEMVKHLYHKSMA